MNLVIRTILILTCIISSASVQAVGLTFGVKTWLSKASSDYVELDADPLESDTSVRSGFNGTIRLNKFFMGASYLEGTFPFEVDFIDEFGPATSVLEIYRTEVDVFAGYYVIPNLAVLGGIKYELVDYIFSDRRDGRIESRNTFILDPEVTFALGLTGFINIRPQLYGFGTASYLEGDFSLEFGASYVLSRWPVNITAGYKYQSYESFTEELGTRILTFGGLIFGLNYTLNL